MGDLAVIETETGEYKPATPIAAQILEEGGCFKEASLQLPAGLTYEDWKGVGRVIQRAEKSVMFWIGDWLNYGESAYGETYAQAIDESNYSYQTLANAKTICGKVESYRRRESLSFSHHAEVASLQPKSQDHWLDAAERNGWSRKELRNEIIRAKRAAIAEGNKALNTATKYRVIYADPPWQYGDARTGTDLYTGSQTHYPTMTIAEMCELPVERIAADDAVLFMWVTSPLIYEAAPLIEAWGFQYKSLFVWDKVKHNVGHYNSVRHEFLLICTRGSCTPDVPKLHDSVVEVERSEKHSEKPEYFRQLIDSMYTDGERIELFRRGGVPDGWSVWGNESNDI